MISIVIPCYNSQKYIAEAINSVINQTFEDWELFVIDDCSDDNTALIIQKMANEDRRIRYLKTNKPSGSPSLPRNIGVKEATGRYIAFLDSDDIWMPNKLERQLKVLESNSNVAICFSNYEKMAESGKRHNRIVKAPVITTYKHLLKGNVIGGLTAIYDTYKVGKMYFQKHPHEDYILWLHILKKGYIAQNTNTVEALYRVRKQSLSSNKFKALLWQWSIYRNIENINILGTMFYFLNYVLKAIRKKMI